MGGHFTIGQLVSRGGHNLLGNSNSFYLGYSIVDYHSIQIYFSASVAVVKVVYRCAIESILRYAVDGWIGAQSSAILLA